MAGDASTITIEQLDGDKRRIELRGPSLPFRGASWKSKLNANTTWYPGNSIQGTQQVLAVQEMPSAWEGIWRRTLMGKTPSIVYDGDEDQVGSHVVNPDTMRDILDEIFRSGSRLRVTWVVIASEEGQRHSTVVREGRAVDWEFPHDTIHDISWKITFDWYSRGETAKKVIATRDNDSAGASAALLTAISNAVPAAVNGQALDATLSPTQFLANAATAVGTYANSLRIAATIIGQATGIINTSANLPGHLANSVGGAVQTCQDASTRLFDTLSRVPSELTTPGIALIDQLSGQRDNADSCAKALAVARAARVYRDKLSSVIAPNMGGRIATSKAPTIDPSSVLRVYVVRDGDTLQSLSAKFYGNADHAIDIAKANRLPWHIVRLDKGKVLLIPALGKTGSE